MNCASSSERKERERLCREKDCHHNQIVTVTVDVMSGTDLNQSTTTCLDLVSYNKKLHWMEMDMLCVQTLEASKEIARVAGHSYDCFDSVKSVIRAAFYEGKTMNLSYTLPAHSVVVQALLNMKTTTIKKLYSIITEIECDASVKLSDVVTVNLHPFLLNMTVEKFKGTVELLYYLKEYFLSLFGVAVLNVTCADRADVLIILSQEALVCNTCGQSPQDDVVGSSLFQCLDCNVSSICRTCLTTKKGQEYLAAHSSTCASIQQLLSPIVETMTFAHLCRNCFTPLHKRHPKNHFNPEISFRVCRKKRSIVYNHARCTVPKCKRDVCVACMKNGKK